MRALRDLMRRVVVVFTVVLLSSGPCAAIPTGDCDGDGKVSVVDALLALRIAVGLDRQEEAVLARCDIGPVDAASVPHPDRQVTMEDALHVLYRSFSVPSWQIPTNVAVPNVVNQPQAAAESILASSLLSVGAVTAEHSDTIAPGVVVGQIPAPSEFTEPAASVSLILSSGPTPPLTIPDVVGLTQQAAVDTLAAKAYRIADVRSASSATISLGTVIGQTPQAGTPAITGSSVSIVVSTGPPAASIVVPDVTRLTQVDAIAAITEASLTVGKISEDSSTTTAIGSVVSQHPAANAKAVPGSAVSLVVSSGAGGLASVPPDPTAMASSLDPAASTSFAAATEFLYKENGIQSGVAAGTIEPRRAAVLRGMVLDKDNLPIPGVNVTVKNHPEFGQTYTRADGGFDLAVNGGGYLTVNYRKDGYLSSQRQVNAPWHDYVWLPDVVLIQLDPRVTAVDLASALPVQAVQGSLVSDVDGTRQATLLISQGTSAKMTLPDGSAIPVSKLNLRATEYTVGQNGDKAMPGQLPPTSAFTYAVEFSADEAIGAGATKVTFSKPLYTYVDDFIGFPVGSAVPAGYYDREKAQWVASENGRVIKILGISGGMAELDVDGTGTAATPDSLVKLNITDAERTKLANLYPEPPKQLWRVPITHFTPWDFNWPYGPPEDATPPPPIEEPTEKLVESPCTAAGSIIECENRVLGESIPIVGTNYSLNYRSNRTPGFTAPRNIKVKVSGSSVPESLIRINLTLSIAGRQIVRSFSPQPNQSFSFTWDGLDCFGRSVSSTPYTVEVTYIYPAIYYPVTNDLANAFARVQGRSGAPGISGDRATGIVALTQKHQGILNGTAKYEALPYWSLNVHHSYDSGSNNIFYGNGQRVKARQIIGGGGVVEIVAKSNTQIFGLSVGPDGSIYFAERHFTDDDYGHSLVKRIGPDGIISTVAGNGSSTYYGDGGPATSAGLRYVTDIAVDTNENLYIADEGQRRVRKVGPDGMITTVAGSTATYWYSSNGLPATKTPLSSVLSVAIIGDGGFYLCAMGGLQKIGTDGLIFTVNTDGRWCDNADVGGDGIVYFTDLVSGKVGMVGKDGIVTTVAGHGNFGYSGDGGPATAADLRAPYDVAVGSDGSFYISEAYRIRKVTPDGIISTVIGGGTSEFVRGRPAKDIDLSKSSQIPSIAIASDGTLYCSYTTNTFPTFNTVIYKISKNLPEYSLGDVVVTSENGSELYHFDNFGRHLRTMNTLTGAILHRFGYDPDGRLISVTDASGAVTTIERDTSGAPLAIVAPFGQRTLISLDNGMVTGITNPAGESHHMTYTAGGLLTSFRDQTGATSTLTYDEKGLLVRDTNVVGGFWELAGITTTAGPLVSKTSGMSRTTTYLTEELAIGGQRRTITEPSGAVTVQLHEASGLITNTGPDGTITTTKRNPDPRFGMMSPLRDVSIKLPSGLTNTSTTSRSIILSSPANLLALTSQSTTTTVNGKTYTSTYDAALKKFTNTTPAGRNSLVSIDYQGRPISFAPDPALVPLTYKYNEKGQLAQLSQGSSSINYGYDGYGRRTSIRNALKQTVAYGYDAADRVNRVTLPSGRTYLFGYNGNGLTTSLTMPNGVKHALDYTLTGMDKSYTPPGTALYSWFYNLDKDWIQTKLPGGRTIDAGYDKGGRPTGFLYPEATVEYLYAAGDPTSRIGSIIRTPAVGGLPQETTYTYDGPLVTSVAVSGVTTGTTSYTYDSNFLLTSINLSTGTDTFNSTIERDEDGLITKFGPFDYTRSGPAGAVSRISDLTLNLSFSYDEVGRISGKKYSMKSLPIFEISYTYDPVGRIATATERLSDGSRSHEYIYDSDGQLKARKENGGVIESYTYDLNGNRTGYTRNGPVSFSLTASFDAQDRMVQQGGTKYSYDVDGYLISGSHASDCRYSAQGELLSATTATGQSIAYSYDGMARRVARHDQTGTYQYFYTNPDQPFQLTAVRDPDGTFTAYYYEPYGSLFAFKRGASTYYVGSDHLGTPRVIADSDGTVVDVMEYDSYGSLLSDSNPSFKLPMGFAGGIVDITGLIRFGFRDYEPSSGRWVSRDPILYKLEEFNLYQYAHNDPVSSLDHDGLQTAIAIPGGLPIFIPTGSVFVPGSQPNKVFVESAAQFLQLFDPRPIASFIIDRVSGGCRQKEEDCDSEIAACTKLCSQARRDPDMKNIWGDSFGACMRGCVSRRCGGN